MTGSIRHLSDEGSTTRTHSDQKTWGAEVGSDFLAYKNNSGICFLGLYAHYGRAWDKLASQRMGGGSIITDGVGGGFTATWLATNGFYLDLNAKEASYQSDLTSNLFGALAKNNGGFGYVTSLEGGKRFALGKGGAYGGGWGVTPQAQITYSKVYFDSYTDSLGFPVSLDGADSLTARLGATLDRTISWQSSRLGACSFIPYGLVNFYYDLLGNTDVKVANELYSYDAKGVWLEVGIGASLNWGDNKYSVFSEVSGLTNIKNVHDGRALKAELGLRAMCW